MYQFHFKSDCITKERARIARESDECIDALLDKAYLLYRDKGAYEIDLGLGPDTVLVRFLRTPLYYSVYTTPQFRDLDPGKFADHPYPENAAIASSEYNASVSASGVPGQWYCVRSDWYFAR